MNCHVYIINLLFIVESKDDALEKKIDILSDGKSDSILKEEAKIEKPLILDEKLSTDDEKNQEASIVIERRFCTVCKVEQIMRSKHCKDCKRCVALYDHHCPWTG